MRVLLALDDSDASLRAAGVARRLFGPDPEYLALQVGRVIPTGMVADPTGLYVLPAEYWDAEAVTPDPYVTQARAEAAGVQDIEVVTDAGDPVQRICEVADEHEADVIVVGAHDKGFWRRLVDPSVSEGVLHRTNRPVLVVHEHAPLGSITTTTVTPAG
ncbi:MAG: universal stress protein [Acidimicrobiales bacterium]|nr:universal stress protein [Acidimicrobiales bacterium]